MQLYELEFVLSSLDYSYRDFYEMCRFNAYVTAQAQSTKKLKTTDILSFSWDKKNDNIKTITDTDISRLKQKAEQMSVYLNNTK